MNQETTSDIGEIMVQVTRKNTDAVERLHNIEHGAAAWLKGLQKKARKDADRIIVEREIVSKNNFLRRLELMRRKGKI